MEKSESSDHLFKRKISIQSNYPDNQLYWYIIEKPGLVYGTSFKTSKGELRLDNSQTSRDFWSDITVEGVLAHMSEIDNSNIELREKYMELETLFPDKEWVRKNKELVLRHFSLVDGTRTIRKRKIPHIKIIFLIFIADDITEEMLLTKEEASQLLDIFEEFKVSDFPLSCSNSVLNLLSNLCDTVFRNDSKFMAKLYHSYIWADEKYLNDIFFSKPEILKIPNTEENKKFAKKLFEKIDNLEYFDTEKSRRTIAQILSKFPFELSMSICTAIISLKSGVESYTLLKSLTEQNVLRRIDTILKHYLGDEDLKMKNFYSKLLLVSRTWKLETEKGHSPFKELFEKHLLELMDYPSLQNTDMVIQIASEQTLFSTLDSKTALLNAIASSPNCLTVELFTKLADVPEFHEVYKDLNASIFQTWYYNYKKTRKGIEKRAIDEVAKRLLMIISLPMVSERKEIQETMKVILIDELKKRLIDNVLKCNFDFAKASKDNSFLTRCFVDYLSTEIHRTSTDPENLFQVILSDGKLQLKTR